MPKKYQGSSVGALSFDPIGNPYIDDKGILHGSFWLENAGWATFDGTTPTAQITCPEDVLRTSEKCLASGYAWSENAGWILLGKNDIGESFEGVYYNPKTSNLEGFGWSSNLGWVPFFSGKNIDDSNENPDNSGVFVVDNSSSTSTPITNVNFIGNVAVIGNIAGTRVFRVVNHRQGGRALYRYDTVRHAPILDAIRGNVAQLTRNL